MPKKNMETYINYRHGDLSFHAIKEKPQKISKISFTGEYVLALGEVTNHAHRLTASPDMVELFQDENGQIILHVKGENKLTHEEHKTLEFIPGWYQMRNEREFNYWENSVKRVVD